MNLPLKQTASTPAAPSDDTQSTLGGAFVCLMINNKAIIGQPPFPNTSIPALQTANDSLATAQANAEHWIGTLSGNVQNQLQHVIDYNTFYNALSADIEKQVRLVRQTPPGSTPPDGTLTNLSEDIAAMQMAVRDRLYGSGGTEKLPKENSVLGVYNQLTAYQRAVAKDQAAFAELLNAANSTSAGIPAEIKAYQDQVKADQDAINKDNAMIAGGAVMMAVGAVIIGALIVSAPESGGATLVLAVGAVGLMAGGAAMTGTAATDLDKRVADMSHAKSQIRSDQQELSLLTSSAHVAQSLEDHCKSVVEAVLTLQTTWQQLDNALGDMVNALNAPEDYLMSWVKSRRPGEEPSYAILGRILEAELAAPAEDWRTASETARTVLRNLANTQYCHGPTNMVPTQENIVAAFHKGQLTPA
ncbi:MAG: HBL/NHE enterotoxin family protein [Pseudomonadota bacterium]